MDAPYYKEFNNKCSYFSFSRNPSMNSPWIINIENGTCDESHKTDHNSNTKLSFFMSETEFAHFVRGMKTLIDVFNYTFGSHLFLKGYTQSRKAEKENREQYNQQNGNGNYQTPANQQTYNAPVQQASVQTQAPPQQNPAPSYYNPPGYR